MSEEKNQSILKSNWHLICLCIGLIVVGVVMGFRPDNSEENAKDQEIFIAVNAKKTSPDKNTNPFTMPSRKKRDATHAISKYEKEIEEYGTSLESEKNLYRIGNLYHSTLFDYEKAVFYYQRLINEYPESGKIEMVYFAIADSYDKLDNYEEEMKTYETIISAFPPESPAHQLAQEKRKGLR